MSKARENTPKHDPNKYVFVGRKKIPLVKNCKVFKNRPLLKSQVNRPLQNINRSSTSFVHSLSNKTIQHSQHKNDVQENNSTSKLFECNFEILEYLNTEHSGDDAYDNIMKNEIFDINNENTSPRIETDEIIILDKKHFHDIHNLILMNEPHQLVKYLQSQKNVHHIINIPTKDDTMQTSIQLAITNKCSLELVKILLKYGANILQQDNEYRNALHYCIDIGEKLYFQMLVEHIFADSLQSHKTMKTNSNIFNFTNPNDIKHIFTTYDIEGNTFLMQCIIKSQIEILKFILIIIPLSVKYSIVNYRNTCNGKTALSLIGELNIGKDLKPKFTKNAEECAKQLLLHGANPNIKNYLGFDSLEFAYRVGNLRYYNFLKKYPYAKEDK